MFKPMKKLDVTVVSSPVDPAIWAAEIHKASWEVAQGGDLG